MPIPRATSPNRRWRFRRARPSWTKALLHGTSICGPLFFYGLHGSVVVPGGLTRVALTRGSLVVNSSQALLRWNHPKWGVVLPGRFIPVAEESGLIIPISLWVLQEACRQHQAWRRAGYPPVRWR